MTRILKYPLKFGLDARCKFTAPAGYILKVAFQERVDAPVAWIVSDSSLGDGEREWEFRMVMTGEELEDDFLEKWSYLDTVFRDWLVLHIHVREGA